MQKDDDLSQPFDGGGRIIMTIRENAGPSWNAIWRDHVRHGWNNRSDANIEPMQPVKAVARRISATQRQKARYDTI